MTAYYNENNPRAAAWLRELIARGHLPAGDVDERSIEDVHSRDVAGYTQCHWFAGIGGWGLALRIAGWPDDRPVWTGSPPCQPFSAAGRRSGYDDARHLAPAWLDIIAQRRPSVVFGEQVASAFATKKHPWIDDLQDALEAEGYAVGKIVLPACGVGAPHIRQRGWIVAERVGDGIGAGLERHIRNGDERNEPGRIDAQPGGSVAEAGCNGRPCGAARTNQTGWDRPDWIFCRDGKWRPVESGTFPLDHGVPARVGRLRGYGNAIVPSVAAEVIGAYMDIFDL